MLRPVLGTGARAVDPKGADCNCAGSIKAQHLGSVKRYWAAAQPERVHLLLSRLLSLLLLLLLLLLGQALVCLLLHLDLCAFPTCSGFPHTHPTKPQTEHPLDTQMQALCGVLYPHAHEVVMQGTKACLVLEVLPCLLPGRIRRVHGWLLSLCATAGRQACRHEQALPGALVNKHGRRGREHLELARGSPRLGIENV